MIYTINKRFHFSNRFIHKILSFINEKKRMSYKVTFNETCIYEDKTDDRFDINKLFGFSNGMHHTNSYRFGWNCLDNKIHVYSYCYIDGKRISNEIGVVNINEQHIFTIYVNHDECVFTVIDDNDKIQQDIIKITNRKIFGYRLWPYFGGNKTAPKKIKIDLEEN